MSGIVSGKVVVVTGGRGIGTDRAGDGAGRRQVVVNDIGVSLAGEGGGDGPAQAVAREIAAAGGRPGQRQRGRLRQRQPRVRAAVDAFAASTR